MLDMIRSFLNLQRPLVLSCPWCRMAHETFLGRLYGSIVNKVGSSWWMFLAPRPQLWRFGAWNHYVNHEGGGGFEDDIPTAWQYYKRERSRTLESRKAIRASKKNKEQ